MGLIGSTGFGMDFGSMEQSGGQYTIRIPILHGIFTWSRMAPTGLFTGATRATCLQAGSIHSEVLTVNAGTTPRSGKSSFPGLKFFILSSGSVLYRHSNPSVSIRFLPWLRFIDTFFFACNILSLYGFTSSPCQKNQKQVAMRCFMERRKLSSP